MKYFFTLSLLLAFITSQSQTLQRTLLPVNNTNNQNIPNPWSGGLNACQLSEIDLNLDGTKDLFVFERTGNRILPFINNGISNTISYHYESAYINAFPPLSDWALLVDYNADGKEDLFAYNGGKVKVYRNTSSATQLEFTHFSNQLITDYSGSPFQLYVSRVDIPAITDVDNDGDIDILTFQSLGGYIEFHENLSMDLYGHADSLIFIMTDPCWGDVYEGLNTYTLNDCNTPLTNLRHTGSSILAIDIDNDADKDLILGDVSYNNLNLLTNGGSPGTSIITNVDQNFPSNNTNTIATDITAFPAAFFLDVNNDGLKDLIASPNIANNCENKESLWLYLNGGSNTAPVFSLHQKNFLQDNTLDFGAGAYPLFYDYNSDGLLDIICGNFGYFNGGDHVGQLAVLENTGTTNQAAFTLVEDDFANLSNLPLNTLLNIPVAGVSPTFGDLDGDGDDDMILGDADGKLHYFENSAGSGNPIQMNLHTNNYFNIDVGQYAAPVLWDLNQDNLLDLVIGKLTGDLLYLPNSGTNTTAIFDTIINDFGQVHVANLFAGYGYSRPYFYTENNATQLLVGSESGHVYHYNNIDNNLNGSFAVVDTFAFDIWDGIKTSVSYQDLNNDSVRDFLIGNQSGGLIYFQSDTTNNNSIIAEAPQNLHMYPNPATHTIYISIQGEKTIYNILGEVVLKTRKKRINIQGLANGVYWIRCNKTVGKFIKQ
ncbi:MAG: hypothetical protein CMP66_01025 [Flavobacteriales bacterium]|nr:hypothetical protein [Flavobacteriales bacterium]